MQWSHSMDIHKEENKMALKTFQFMAENAGPWYDRLDGEEKAKIEKSVGRLNAQLNHVKRNGLPAEYHGAAKKIADRLNANPSYLTDEAVFALDNVIAMTVEDQNMYGDVVREVTTPQMGTKWYTKSYKLDELDVNSSKTYPHPDTKFRDVVTFGLGVEPEVQEGMGFSIGYTIPWTEIAEASGSIYSPEYYYALKAAERMGVIIDENGFLGGAGQHMYSDFGLKGLINHASIQSFTATTLTTYGNIRLSLWNALGDLKKQYAPGTVKLICSSGYASQMFYNRFGYTDVAEFESIRRELSPYIPEAYVDDRIIGDTPSNSNQVAALVKIGRTLQSHKLVYPLQSKPRMDKMYAEDVSEVLIHGDILAQYGNSPFPVTVASSLSTTDTGFIPNGRLW
jgi:hypothetical protein